MSSSVAAVDLGAIQRNLESVRGRVGDRMVLAAVKANAYGHGAVEVSRMIEQTGCADGSVSPWSRRRSSCARPGSVCRYSSSPNRWTPPRPGRGVMADVTLAVVDEARSSWSTRRRAGRRASVHLKVDTGMGRIGCRPEDAAELARRVDAAGLDLGGVFSHLPVADLPDAEEVEYTRAQARRFAEVCDAVEAARGPVPLRHLANSGGVLQHPETWFDMVRPGIMIYGSLPDPGCEASVPLEPVLSWTTRVSFVKDVAAGSRSAGRTWVAPVDTKVATVPRGIRGRLLPGAVQQGRC